MTKGQARMKIRDLEGRVLANTDAAIRATLGQLHGRNVAVNLDRELRAARNIVACISRIEELDKQHRLNLSTEYRRDMAKAKRNATSVLELAGRAA